MSIIGKEKYIKNIIHTCNVFNILSIHYYRLIRKQAFNNPLITNPHIADVPAIDEKNTKNSHSDVTIIYHLRRRPLLPIRWKNAPGVDSLQKTLFHNLQKMSKKIYHSIKIGNR